MLDTRICEKCPLGPKPHTRPECRRCEADLMAVEARKTMLLPYREALTVNGVDLTACFEYDLLPALLPHLDPAREYPGDSAS